MKDSISLRPTLPMRSWFVFLSLLFLFELVLLLILDGYGTQTLVVGSIILCVFFIVLVNPLYGLLFCLFIEFSGIVWGLDIPYGFFVVVLLTGLSWVFDQTARSKFTFNLDAQYLWVLGFLIAILLSFFVAFDLEKTLSSFLSFLKLAFFYFLIIQLCTSREAIKYVILIMVGATLFSLLFGVISMFVPLPIFGTVQQGFRFRGLTSDPNILAIHILIIFPILFFYFFQNRKPIRRWLLAFLLVISFLGLLTTFSRSATLGFVAILACLLFAIRKKRVLMLITLILFLIGISMIPDIFWERILSLKNIYQDPSLRWRARLFIGALQLFINHPIFGIGMGNFVLISNQFTTQHLAVHNMFLEVATETGLIGFLFFIGLVISYIFRLNVAQRIFMQHGDKNMSFVCKGLLVAFAGIFISSLFYSLEEYFVLWTLFGLGTALYQKAQKRKGDAFSA